MNALLDPLRNGAITLPGAHQLTLTGIVFAGEPSSEEFSAIMRLAQSVERAQAWLVGDVVVEYVRRLQFTRPGTTVVNAVAEYSMANGMQIEQVRARYDIARFYPHADRNASLTWSHHWVLNAFGFRLPECRAWLKRAQDGNWTIAQLRAEIKAAKRPKLPPEPTLPSLCPDWLRDAIDHASGCLRDLDALPPEAAATLLAEAEPLAAYIDTLRAKVAPQRKDLRDLQSQQGGAPGKESIKPAA